jgi:hypothetical protein
MEQHRILAAPPSTGAQPMRGRREAGANLPPNSRPSATSVSRWCRVAVARVSFTWRVVSPDGRIAGATDGKTLRAVNFLNFRGPSWGS